MSADFQAEASIKANSPRDVLPDPRRLRLWPGVALVVLYWAAAIIPALIAPGTMLHIMFAMWSPMLVLFLFLVWWVFGSRIRWGERGIVLFGVLAVAAIAIVLYDPSMRGMGGFQIMMSVVPVVLSAWIVWLLATMFVGWPFRRYGLLTMVALVWIYYGLMRMDGVDGAFQPAFNYRWTPTAEELFLARSKEEKASSPDAGQIVVSALEVDAATSADWPEFRGVLRDGSRSGVKIATDWKARPPKEIWRRRVGPGWSSFAVVGNRLFTQEQRGEDEVVVCYDANKGTEIWVHSDPVRFTEAIAGPGPRATPTYVAGKLYSLGANGILNCLDARTGEALWSRNIVKDSDAKIPTWGFAASPLVVNGIVSVFAGGPNGKGVLAYQADTGEPAWTSGGGEQSYCSTQLSTIDGVEQLLVATELGVTAFEPVQGAVLWQFDWLLEGGMARVIQPAIVGATDFLVGTGFGNGTKRVRVTRQGETWTTQELWHSTAFKPYYNDFVIHGNSLYGFDSTFFVCVGLDDGKVKWKARGYGNGEVVLLADQGLLIVLTEQGEVVLVEANDSKHVVLGRIAGITGKTWNHPVVAHGKLFIRNGEEAAAFELPVLEESTTPQPNSSEAEETVEQ